MWRARFWRRTAQDSCALGAAGAWASGSLLPLQSAVPLRGKSQSDRFSEICNINIRPTPARESQPGCGLRIGFDMLSVAAHERVAEAGARVRRG